MVLELSVRGAHVPVDMHVLSVCGAHVPIDGHVLLSVEHMFLLLSMCCLSAARLFYSCAWADCLWNILSSMLF
jgi:hypothetical protein